MSLFAAQCLEPGQHQTPAIGIIRKDSALLPLAPRGVQVRVANGAEKPQAADILRRRWGEPILARGHTFLFEVCQIFLAGDMEGIAAVSYDEPPFIELVAINAGSDSINAAGKGVGSALIGAIASSASALGFEAIRLTTTNDNVDGLRFYQRRGCQLAALRPGVVDESRKPKPTISMTGQNGIPIHDELDLIRSLRTSNHFSPSAVSWSVPWQRGLVRQDLAGLMWLHDRMLILW
jgi:Acetyltransferase (GNAT) family